VLRDNENKRLIASALKVSNADSNERLKRCLESLIQNNVGGNPKAGTVQRQAQIKELLVGVKSSTFFPSAKRPPLRWCRDLLTDARVLTSFIEEDYPNRCTYETTIQLEQDTLD